MSAAQPPPRLKQAPTRHARVFPALRLVRYSAMFRVARSRSSSTISDFPRRAWARSDASYESSSPKQLQPNDLVAIIRTGGEMGALQQFTNDQRLLSRAVDQLRWNICSRVGVSVFERRVVSHPW